ncbi:MAG: response regulator [Rhodospirillales bacterium]|nr:response regulator [Alphaproteobacteria bacterium]MCB1840770.1 response regulator [Alphaproteobacteria bacterium]MCB9977152.1 response regulator [Rhodospirillales bacterium]
MAYILVVDDEPGVLITLKTMLKVDGHNVLVAENGKRGIEELKSNLDVIDLVITDIQMPEMDGLQFIHDLLEITKDIPVVAISGGGNKIANFDPLESLQDKILGIIRKPFTHDELFETINSVLESSRGARANS